MDMSDGVVQEVRCRTVRDRIGVTVRCRTRGYRTGRCGREWGVAIQKICKREGEILKWYNQQRIKVQVTCITHYGRWWGRQN